jgi:hypothetical protein
MITRTPLLTSSSLAGGLKGSSQTQGRSLLNRVVENNRTGFQYRANAYTAMTEMLVIPMLDTGSQDHLLTLPRLKRVGFLFRSNPPLIERSHSRFTSEFRQPV